MPAGPSTGGLVGGLASNGPGPAGAGFGPRLSKWWQRDSNNWPVFLLDGPTCFFVVSYFHKMFLDHG